MTKVSGFLFFGCSSIAARRVLPAIAAVAPGVPVDMASVSREETARALVGGTVYGDYGEALSSSSADTVYVSLTNEQHERWAEAALDSGRHVIVDKPAFLGADATKRLVAKARDKGLVLAEATVFLDHAQFADHADDWPGGGGLRVEVTFSMPGFAPDDFRYNPARGGGALWDLGPYAVATARHFFEMPPETVVARILTHHPETGVDTAFAVLFGFADGGAMTGLFGFDTEYRNCLAVFSREGAVELNRAFSTPPDFANTLHVRRGNAPLDVSVEPSDAFQGFLVRFLTAVRTGDGQSLANAIVKDAILLERVRNAAETMA